jgi:hypothetical protein
MATDTQREARGDAERELEHTTDELQERVAGLGDDIEDAKSKARARREDAGDDDTDDDDDDAGDPSAFDDPEEDDEEEDD